MRMHAPIAALVAGLMILGCGDDPTGPPEPQPQPGELRVTVASGTAVGVAVLTVTGAGIAAPAASAGAQLYYDLSGSTLSAVVAGSSLSGEIMRFTVPDVRQVASYQISLAEAAGTANQPLATNGISVSVVQ